MACERYEVSLQEAALGEPLSEDAARHVRECAACTERLAAERRLMTTIDSELQEGAAAEPSVEFLSRVRERVAREREKPARRVPAAVWTALAAAAVLVVAIGLVYGRRAPAPSVAEVRSTETPTAATAPPLPPVEPPVVAPAEPVTRRRARSEPEVLVDSKAAQALARYVARTRRAPGQIAGSIDRRVVAVDRPRFDEVTLVSDDLLMDPPRYSAWKEGSEL